VGNRQDINCGKPIAAPSRNFVVPNITDADPGGPSGSIVFDGTTDRITYQPTTQTTTPYHIIPLNQLASADGSDVLTPSLPTLTNSGADMIGYDDPGAVLSADNVRDALVALAGGAAPETLAGLSDTTITTPADGDLLVYDGMDSWDNVVPGSHISSGSGAIDVDVTADFTWTGTHILDGDKLQIQDTSSTHQYVFAVNELTADQTVTLPLLTDDDTFVFRDHAMTLTNKTITAAANTLTIALDDISDVVLTTPAVPAFLKWNGTAWVDNAFGTTLAFASQTLNVAVGDGLTNTGSDLAVNEAFAFDWTVTHDFAAGLTIGDARSATIDAGRSTSGNLVFTGIGPANSATIKAPVIGSSYTITLPGDMAVTGGILYDSDGAGTMVAAKISSTQMNLGASFTWTGTHTFDSGKLELGDSVGDHQYLLTAGGDLDADRVVQFPILTGDDFLLCLSHDVGSTVQAYDAQLDDISALAVTDGNIIVGDGANWVAESGDTARVSLGVGTTDSPTFTGLTVSDVSSGTGSNQTVPFMSSAGLMDDFSTFYANVASAGSEYVRVFNGLLQDFGGASWWGHQTPTLVSVLDHGIVFGSNGSTNINAKKTTDILITFGGPYVAPFLLTGVEAFKFDQNSGGQPQFQMFDGASPPGNYVGFSNPGSVGTSYILDLPADLPNDNGAVLATTTGGVMTFSDDIFSVATGHVDVKASVELRFYEDEGDNYVGLKGPNNVAVGSSPSVIWELPEADGNASDVLTTDGAGIMSFQHPTHREITSVSANTNIELTHGVVTVDTTGGDRTMTLPTAASATGVSFTFVKEVAANTLLITGDGSETINGSTTLDWTPQYSNPTVTSDGTEWFITAGG